jgi:hypothetical protein
MIHSSSGLCQKHYDYDLDQRPGWKSGWVPATETRDHINRLKATGVTYRRIAEIAEMNEDSVRKIAKGRRQRVQAMTAEAVLAIDTAVDLDLDGRHPAIGFGRRLQGLVALGYTQQWMADQFGLTREALDVIIHGRAMLVEGETGRKIDALYQRLHLTPAPDSPRSRVARRVAKRRNWVLPMYWDEDAIDDPDAAPHGVRVGKTDWYDSYLELLEFGIQPKAAAERLGVPWETVYRRVRYNEKKAA